MRFLFSLSLSLSLSLFLSILTIYQSFFLSKILFLGAHRLLFALIVVPYHERDPTPMQHTERRKNTQWNLFMAIVEHG